MLKLTLRLTLLIIIFSKILQITKFIWIVWVTVRSYREKNFIPKIELFWKISVRYGPNCFKL